MKKVITEMTAISVNITISAEDCDDVVLVLPVNMVSPQISLQIAGMISSDPQIPRKNEKAE